MVKETHPVEVALRSGSRAKNYSRKISELCRRLPPVDQLGELQRQQVMRMAAACRAGRAVMALFGVGEMPAIEAVAEFSDLFCEMYYPVLEDGKRTVGFWSVKDSATLTPCDVHEWVRDTRINSKTGVREQVVVPFGTWWGNHRPDYELYGVASDRSMWNKKVILSENGRKCVNTAYGEPPVITQAPEGYGDGATANEILEAVLARTICDSDAATAQRKRQNFVLDAGAHLLALRDGGRFRCRKLFCFCSTNDGQGTGKSFLQESLAALVPRDASCTVQATCLAGDNLLPLYASSVCILKEAPSTSNERYTAEDIKSFADAGWKTAQEKYVAKRSVRDNSLKLLSSNHMSPLPIDSPRSRRIEFFVAEDTKDGGAGLRRLLDAAEIRMGWTPEQMRACVGWALLCLAARYLDEGGVPFAVARRTIDAEHLLSPFDYDYFVTNSGNLAPSYSDYRDTRSDKGFSWSPDAYRFKVLAEMSRATETWVDDLPDDPPPSPADSSEGPCEGPAAGAEESVDEDGEESDGGEAPEKAAGPVLMQYKHRMATAYLAPERMSVAALYAYIVGDQNLKEATSAVRAGTADKRKVLRQVFPGATFSRFSRSENLVGWTGLTHVDFDHVAENGNGITPEQIRDALSELPGFIIGGLSSRANGAWGIFHAGQDIKDYDTYIAAERSLFAMCEEKICMKCDQGPRLPTLGRTLAHDPDCRICDEAIVGDLPAPYPWKAPTFAAIRPMRLAPSEQKTEQTADEAVRNERFLEKVVENSCEKIQQAAAGERHDTAIKAVANVVLCCQERAVAPLSSWGRRLRDACRSVGLDHGETNSIMAYWRQRTGLAG